MPLAGCPSALSHPLSKQATSRKMCRPLTGGLRHLHFSRRPQIVGVCGNHDTLLWLSLQERRGFLVDGWVRLLYVVVNLEWTLVVICVSYFCYAEELAR